MQGFEKQNLYILPGAVDRTCPLCYALRGYIITQHKGVGYGKRPAAPKKVLGAEPVVFLVLFIAFFALFGFKMGLINMLSTLMQTAFRLLLDTVLYITAVAVASAMAGLLQEFGVVALVDRLVT